MSTYQELLAMKQSELQKKYADATRKVLEVKLHIAAGQERNTSKLRKAKKEVARILTAMNQQQLQSFVSK